MTRKIFISVKLTMKGQGKFVFYLIKRTKVTSTLFLYMLSPFILSGAKIYLTCLVNVMTTIIYVFTAIPDTDTKPINIVRNKEVMPFESECIQSILKQRNYLNLILPTIFKKVV